MTTSVLTASITHRDCTCTAAGTTYGCATGTDRLTELHDLGLCLNTDNHVADGDGDYDCTVCGLYEVSA